MEFGNPIVGGTDLIREAIKSPDFTSDPETGVSGWQISRDGTATFYNLVIGSQNYTIDENGNAVFASVSADSITLNGESLADKLLTVPRGIVAMNISPNNSQFYDGTNSILWNRLVISNFDPTRMYKVGFICRANVVASHPNFVSPQIRYSWTGNTTASSTALAVWQDSRSNDAASDTVLSGEFVFTNSNPPGENMYLGFYISAQEAGLQYEASGYGRAWVEDIGPTFAYGSFDASGSGTNPPSSYTKTYSANWSESYQSDGDSRGVAECYQGYYSGTNGNQFSLIGFPYATIQSDLSGATVTKTELYLNNNHFYSNSGGTAIIGTHNYASEPATASLGSVSENLDSESFTYGQAKWFTVTNTIANNIKNNTGKGIALGPGPSTSQSYYGYFAGNGQSGEPQLRITYSK